MDKARADGANHQICFKHSAVAPAIYSNGSGWPSLRWHQRSHQHCPEKKWHVHQTSKSLLCESCHGQVSLFSQLTFTAFIASRSTCLDWRGGGLNISCLTFASDLRRVSSNFSLRGARRKPPMRPLIISRLRSASSMYSFTRFFWFSRSSMRACRAAARACFSSWINFFNSSTSKFTQRSPFWRQKSGEFSLVFSCGHDLVAWSQTSQGHSPVGAELSKRDKTRRWESCSSSELASSSSSSSSLVLSTSSKRTNPGAAFGSALGFNLDAIFGWHSFRTKGFLGSVATCWLDSLHWFEKNRDGLVRIAFKISTKYLFTAFHGYITYRWLKRSKWVSGSISA